ncbi:MAG: helix-turn-helix domain-containing protein [Acidimicrobiia bacterium]|nr:helix-turn-helix domain-containing protein [Acidimicrobiia bacterium]
MSPREPSGTLVEPLLGPGDVSALLGVPTATLANWRCAGKGPPFLRVGRHVRYRRGDVEGWIDGQIRDPRADTPHR